MTPAQTWKTEKHIVTCIRRYRIAVEDILVQSISGDVPTAVRRLIRDRRLHAHVHDAGVRYLTLRSKPNLSDVALVRALAILRFCHARGCRRTLLTRHDIRQYFPQLFRHGMPGGHYLDTQQRPLTLGQIHVDTVPSRISRIVSRTARRIDGCRQQPGFRELISMSGFEICWLVPTRHKAARLQTALEPLTASGVRIRVAQVSGILELLAPVPNQQAAPPATTRSQTNQSRP